MRSFLKFLTPSQRADQVDLRFCPTFDEWSGWLNTARSAIAEEVKGALLDAQLAYESHAYEVNGVERHSHCRRCGKDLNHPIHLRHNETRAARVQELMAAMRQESKTSEVSH